MNRRYVDHRDDRMSTRMFDGVCPQVKRLCSQTLVSTKLCRLCTYAYGDLASFVFTWLSDIGCTHEHCASRCDYVHAQRGRIYQVLWSHWPHRVLNLPVFCHSPTSPALSRTDLHFEHSHWMPCMVPVITRNTCINLQHALSPYPRSVPPSRPPIALSLHAAIDIEVHRGTDGRAYILDTVSKPTQTNMLSWVQLSIPSVFFTSCMSFRPGHCRQNDPLPLGWWCCCRRPNSHRKKARTGDESCEHCGRTDFHKL